MDDLDRYARERAAWDPAFADGLARESQAFRFGLMLRQAREFAGLTQEQVAKALGTQKSAVSRMENHAEDVRLSTLQRYAEAVGLELVLELQPREAEKPAPRRVSRPRRKLVAADTEA